MALHLHPLIRKLVDGAARDEDVRFDSHGTRFSTHRFGEFEQQLDSTRRQYARVGRSAQPRHPPSLSPHRQQWKPSPMSLRRQRRKPSARRARRRQMDVRTFFSPSAYECDEVLVQRPGTLAMLFRFYAALFSPERQLAGKAGLTFSGIALANATMSQGEFAAFARDFGLVPHLVRRPCLDHAWRANRSAHGGGKMKVSSGGRGSAEAQGGAGAAMNFSGFVQVLVRLALVAFTELRGAGERVEALAGFLQLDDLASMKTKLGAMSRLAQASSLARRR